MPVKESSDVRGRMDMVSEQLIMMNIFRSVMKRRKTVNLCSLTMD